VTGDCRLANLLKTLPLRVSRLPASALGIPVPAVRSEDARLYSLLKFLLTQLHILSNQLFLGPYRPQQHAPARRNAVLNPIVFHAPWGRGCFPNLDINRTVALMTMPYSLLPMLEKCLVGLPILQPLTRILVGHKRRKDQKVFGREFRCSWEFCRSWHLPARQPLAPRWSPNL